MSKHKRKRLEWPADGSPARYEDLAQPFRALFLRLFPEFDPSAAVGHNDYDGLPLDTSEAAVCCEPNELLSKSGLRRRAEQGDDALDVFIGCVLRVGMAQGRRTLLDRSMRVILNVAADKLDKDGFGGKSLADVLRMLADHGKVEDR